MDKEILKTSPDRQPEREKDKSVYEEDVFEDRSPVSRRRFLKIAGKGLAGAGVALALPSLYEGVWNNLKKDELEKKIATLEEELSNKYGIRIRIWEPHFQDRPDGTIRESLKKHSLYRSYKSLLSLKKALGCYPPGLIKDSVSGIEIVYSVKPAYEVSRTPFFRQCFGDFFRCFFMPLASRQTPRAAS